MPTLKELYGSQLSADSAQAQPMTLKDRYGAQLSTEPDYDRMPKKLANLNRMVDFDPSFAQNARSDMQPRPAVAASTAVADQFRANESIAPQSEIDRNNRFLSGLIDSGTIDERLTLKERISKEWDRSSGPIGAPLSIAALLLKEAGQAGTGAVRSALLDRDRVGNRPFAVPTQEQFQRQSPEERIAKSAGRGLIGYPLGIADFLTSLPDMIANPPEGETTGGQVKGLAQGAAELPLGVPAMLSEVGRNLREDQASIPSKALGYALLGVEPFVDPANRAGGAIGFDNLEQTARENVRISPESLIYGVQIGKVGLRKAGDLIGRGAEYVRGRVARADMRNRVAENVAESQTAREASRFDLGSAENQMNLNRAMGESRATEAGVRSILTPEYGAPRLPAPAGYGEGFTFRDVRPERSGNPNVSAQGAPTGRPVRLAGPNNIIRPRMEFEKALRSESVPTPKPPEFRTETGRGATQAAPAPVETPAPVRRLEAPGSAKKAAQVKADAAKAGVDIKTASKYGAAGAAIVATVAAADNDEDRAWMLAGLGFIGMSKGRGDKTNIRGRAAEIARKVKSGDVSKELQARYPLNLNTLNIDAAAKGRISRAEQALAVELEKIKGRPVTHEEIIDAAAVQKAMAGIIPRQQQVEIIAAVNKARQQLSAAAKYETLTPELVESLAAVSSWKTFSGRLQESLKIGADPVLSSTRNIVLDKILKKNQNVEAILERAKTVDWTDSRQVTDLYRQFVKPDVWEWLDEYRYINLLSSPRTHIVNSFSNALQGAVLRPSTMAFGAAIDNIASIAKPGRARTRYLSQIPAYYRGYFNSFPEASRGALRALSGKDILERPDVPRIPTGSKVLKPFYFIPRALEAGDVFFRTMITEAEYASLAELAKKQGKKFNAAEARVTAENTAAELVFRKTPDPGNLTGQGSLLSSIDKATDLMYKARDIKAVRWFVPFVMTPMNIFKQGFEYSPLGFLTIRKNADPVGQMSKAMVGSMVCAGAAGLALDGRTTWSVPTGKDQRQKFYEAGMSPYSIKIGDKWISYSKLGPLAYPIAMAAAFRHGFVDQNKAMTDSDMEKISKSLGGIAGFFSDQSYVQGLGEMIDAIRGDEGAITRVQSNIPRQLIPLSSLQGWTNTLVDPYYRKSDNLVDDLKKNIVFLSDQVPPYTDSDGEPSKRELRGLNAVSPFGVRTEKPTGMTAFQSDLSARQKRAVRDMAKDYIRDGRGMEAGRLIAQWNKKHPNDPVESYAELQFAVRESEARKAARQ